MSKVVLAWISGYPAHYMREFHRELRSAYADQVQFTYAALSKQGAAFKHEQGKLPENANVLSNAGQTIAVWKWLNKIQPSIVLISGHYPKANLIAAIWAKYKGRQLYYWSDTNVKDERHKKRSFLRRLFIDIFFHLPNTFLYIGSRNKEYYLSKLENRKKIPQLKFLPLPHNPKTFSVLEKKIPEKFTFLYLGRLAKEKGINRILEAYASIPEEFKEQSIMVIAGYGPEEEALKELSKKLEINRNVKFIGTVMSNAVPEVIANSNIVVLASDNEPWGLIVNEALSTARPVIGPSSIGAFKDLIIDEVTGYTVTSSEPELLKEAMIKAIKNPEHLNYMGEVGKNLILEKEFNLNKSIKVIGEMLEVKAVENNHNASRNK